MDLPNGMMGHMAGATSHVTSSAHRGRVPPMVPPQGPAVVTPFPALPNYNFQGQGGVPGSMPRIPGMFPQQAPYPGNLPVNFHGGSMPGGSQNGGGVVQPGADHSRKPEKGPPSKKAKLDLDDGSDQEDGKMRTKLSTEEKKSQHCEVEKKRRERMNRYMSELAQMIPACNAVPRRLDKLSILKMTVDHMKALRGDPHSASEYKPGFLTDDELKKMLVQAANAFMMIIECSQAKLLYVSDTIEEVLDEEPKNWIGSCLYDLLHPKDIPKVKEQLTCFDVEEAKKASSMKPGISNSPLIMHNQSMNGLRRSFLCRVKKMNKQQKQHVGLGASKPPGQDVDCTDSESMMRLLHSSQQCVPFSYAVLHFTGFVRNLTTAEKQSLQVEESSIGACLVAVARLQHFGDTPLKPSVDTVENEFVARVGVDGRFTYVDPRVMGVLGYLPQDLVGQVSYEYYHPDDIQKMVHLHHDAMKQRTPMPTVQYRFLTKNQKWLWLAMKAFSFINPFSQQVEYVVCTNVTMLSTSSQDTASEVSSVMGEQPASASAVPVSRPGKTPNDVKKQERIERYVRMTIQNQAESLLARNNATNVKDDVPSTSAPESNPFTANSTSEDAVTTIEENAATVQRILEDYNKMHSVPPPKKDMNYKFPEGLFSTEVDLLGSQEAYRNILTEFDNPADFTLLFDQVEADPMRPPSNIFQDLSMDIFD